VKYEISVAGSKTYLHIHVNEPVTEDVLEDFVRETAEKAMECRINNFFFDLRRAPNRTSWGNYYHFVHRRYSQLGFDISSKHALVVSPEDMNDYRFVETVLINAGYNGKMYTDELAAIAWLEE
jgi:hypothetical protein